MKKFVCFPTKETKVNRRLILSISIHCNKYNYTTGLCFSEIALLIRLFKLITLFSLINNSRHTSIMSKITCIFTISCNVLNVNI